MQIRDLASTYKMIGLESMILGSYISNNILVQQYMPKSIRVCVQVGDLICIHKMIGLEPMLLGNISLTIMKELPRLENLERDKLGAQGYRKLMPSQFSWSQKNFDAWIKRKTNDFENLKLKPVTKGAKLNITKNLISFGLCQLGLAFFITTMEYGIDLQVV